MPFRPSCRWLLIVFGWLLLVLHAVAMPIQYDEAVAILSVHEHGIFSAFTRYEEGTNNHPLLSFFLGLLLSAGATQPIMFRLPSLIAAFIVLVAADHMGKPHWPPSARLLVPLLVSLPIFFDYFALARGYAVGLAFLVGGILAFRRSVIVAGLLFALAVLCVPSYALDVAIVSAAMLLSRESWRRVAATLGIAAGLSLSGYAAIVFDVITTVRSLSGESKLAALHELLAALSGYGAAIGALLLLAGIVLAVWRFRERNFLAAAFLVSLPCLAMGYARTHLLAALLLFFVVLSSLTWRRWTPAAIVTFCVGSLLLLPWDRIASEPNTWPVSGFSVARRLSPCLTVQRRGLFAVPHMFYERLHKGQLLRSDCPHFLMVAQPSLNIPAELRLYPDVLSPYDIEMYRQEDLHRVLQERIDQLPPTLHVRQ